MVSFRGGVAFGGGLEFVGEGSALADVSVEGQFCRDSAVS